MARREEVERKREKRKIGHQRHIETLILTQIIFENITTKQIQWDLKRQPWTYHIGKKSDGYLGQTQPPIYLFIVVLSCTHFYGYLGQNQNITYLFSDPPFLLTRSPSSFILFFSLTSFFSFFSPPYRPNKLLFSSLGLAWSFFSLILIQEIIWASMKKSRLLYIS